MSSPLTFTAFFQAVHGVTPFPWQVALADQVTSSGEWPAVIAAPTGSGKTAAIDVAVFALALEADRDPVDRRAALRTFFVVDRRVVVDEAHARALKIQSALRTPASSVVAEVADRLKRTAAVDGAEPLHVSIMRGGMYREPAWTPTPLQPTVCVSTVDQVGSRLLFRGYGVSEFARPIHAGLVGQDTLVILDEAHISQPFVETLDAVSRYAGRAWAEQPIARPVRVVQMTATPKPSPSVLRLSKADLKDVTLARRLSAQKVARLLTVEASKKNEAETLGRLAAAVVQQATAVAGLASEAQSVSSNTTRGAKKRGALKPGEGVLPARVIGIVVNRVATARRAFTQLCAAGEGGARFDTILLTGRTRPFDRDQLLHSVVAGGEPVGWLPFVTADRSRRRRLDRPLFVVATQTIEVGADLDFDALVTEAASLDALRQRFGRLDRLGERHLSHAVIAARKDLIARNADDPVYGGAIAATWKQLEGWEDGGKGQDRVVDFGLASMQGRLDKLTEEEMVSLCTPTQHAPVMLPAHVDTWCQTSPAAVPEPDVSLFLHGCNTAPADVMVVWRADLPEDLTVDNAEQAIETVARVPPVAVEAIAVPVYAVRQWLHQNREDQSIGDVEGASVVEGRVTADHAAARNVLRWCGRDDDRTRVVGADRIRPGDTIVVPASHGGADVFGWDPASRTPVTDIGDAAVSTARGRTVLRLHPAVIATWQPPDRDGEGRTLADVVMQLMGQPAGDDAQPDVETEPDVDAALDAITSWQNTPGWAASLTRELRTAHKSRALRPTPDAKGWVVEGRARAALVEVAVDDDASWQTQPTRDVTLEAHSNGVRMWAERFAAVLAQPLRHDLAIAAWLHDLGKADSRFQTWLHGGDEVAAAMAGELLAKSPPAMGPGDRAAIRRARELAGYPRGGRHESMSVALLHSTPTSLSRAHDAALVRYLVGVHHGHGRPFMPVAEDPQPVEVALSHGGVNFLANSDHRLYELASGWPDLFWQLVRRYGWWGVAYIEAVLRLADQRRSHDERE